MQSVSVPDAKQIHDRYRNRIQRNALARLVYVRHKPQHPHHVRVSPRGQMRGGGQKDNINTGEDILLLPIIRIIIITAAVVVVVVASIKPKNLYCIPKDFFPHRLCLFVFNASILWIEFE